MALRLARALAGLLMIKRPGVERGIGFEHLDAVIGRHALRFLQQPPGDASAGLAWKSARVAGRMRICLAMANLPGWPPAAYGFRPVTMGTSHTA